jgi:hypothetical protein
MRKLVLVLVILCLSLNLAVKGENQDATSGPGEKKSTDGAVSIYKFIPGIPQLKSGNTIKGLLLLGSFLGVVTGTVVYNHLGNQSYQKYQHSTNVEEILLYRQQTERNFKKRNLCLVGLFSVWLIHILDLKFFKSGKVGVKSDVGKNNIDVGFYYSF